MGGQQTKDNVIVTAPNNNTTSLASAGLELTEVLLIAVVGYLTVFVLSRVYERVKQHLYSGWERQAARRAIRGSSTPFPILSNDLEPTSGRRCVLLDIVTGGYKTEDCGSEVKLTNSEAPPVDYNTGFICKKTVKRSLCHTVDEGYKYNEVTKKCYKVSKQLRTWNDAYRQCYMEGAMLFVPEDSEEFEQVTRYISTDERTNTYHYRRSRYGNNNDESKSYFIGIYQPQALGEYFTIQGVPMESGGIYQRFDPSDDRQIQETNQSGGANCITLRNNQNDNEMTTYFYTIDACIIPRQFICEMKSTLFT